MSQAVSGELDDMHLRSLAESGNDYRIYMELATKRKRALANDSMNRKEDKQKQESASE